jgi:hypothetical protein
MNNGRSSEGDNRASNAFVTKLNSSASALVYSTYLGGTGYGNQFGGPGGGDGGGAIALDSSGHAYVTGYTYSDDFPVTSGSFQTTHGAHVDNNAFLTELNIGGTSLLYSTYLGGSGNSEGGYGDSASGIALDSYQNVYLAGSANSSDFPVTPGAFQTTNHAFVNNTSNAFVTKFLFNSTTTALSSSPNPSAVGQAVTFTATVNAQVGGSPSGTVQFFNYGYSLGTAPLVDGKARLTATGFSANAHPITAAYSGSTNDSPSTSATYTQVVKVATSTTISASANPATYGQPITFTATVTPTTSGTPTGTVQFLTLGYSLGTATLVNGKASLTATGFSVNSHPITAVYSGDANYLTSSAPTFTEVVKAATTVTISSSANPSVSGKPITFTATVAPSGFSGVPTGTVQFFNFGYSLGTATLVNGKASLTATGFSVNTHPITASYSGDTEFLPSNAATYEQVVGK